MRGEGREEGHLFPAHDSRSLMLTLLDQFTCVPIHRVSSAGLPRRDSGPAFASVGAGKEEVAAGGSRVKQGGQLFHHHPAEKGGCSSYAPSCSQGWLTCASVYSVHSTVLPWPGTGPFLLSAAGSEGPGKEGTFPSPIPQHGL